jgi:hypothetical protein
MTTGEFKLISDCLLLERTLKVIAELEAEENGGDMVKNAFDMSSFFSGILGTIKNSVAGQAEGQSPLHVAVRFLAPAMFFRLNPVLGILVTIAQSLGFDLVSIFEKIANPIIDMLKSNKPIKPEDVDQLGRAAAASLGATASEDLLGPLRKLDKYGLKVAIAEGAFSSAWGKGFLGTSGGVPWMGQGLSPLQRMFTFMAPSAGKNILVGFIVSAIKTVLMSCGLLAGVGLAAGAVGLLMHGNKPVAGTVTPAPGHAHVPAGAPKPGQPGAPTVQPSSSAAHAFKSKPEEFSPHARSLGYGEGDEYYDDRTIDTNGMTPEQILQTWIFSQYPQLGLTITQDQLPGVLRTTPEYTTVVNKLRQYWTPGSAYLRIPEELGDSSNEILGRFMPQVLRTLQAKPVQPSQQLYDFERQYQESP